MVNNFGVDYVFDSRHGAEEALDELKQIAMSFGSANSIDFAWVVGEDTSRILSTSIFWVTDFEMRQARVDKVKEGWVIITPTAHLQTDENNKNAEVDQNENNKNNKNNENNENTEVEQRNEENGLSSEPIFITIHLKELESPWTYISDIFKNVNSIKDRMVNITIIP